MIILGSQSPRRREILSYFSVPFRQETSNFDEQSIPWEGDPVSYSQQISDGKAGSLAKIFKDEPILTADTVVFQNGKIFLKPRDEEDAYQILNELTGSWHSVFTAITLIVGEKQFSDVEETKVLFNPLTEMQIRRFLHKLPYADKAGAYFIQEAGSLLVNKIEGCFYNVMGLPINSVHKILLNIHLDLWDYLLPPEEKIR